MASFKLLIIKTMMLKLSYKEIWWKNKNNNIQSKAKTLNLMIIPCCTCTVLKVIYGIEDLNAQPLPVSGRYCSLVRYMWVWGTTRIWRTSSNLEVPTLVTGCSGTRRG